MRLFGRAFAGRTSRSGSSELPKPLSATGAEEKARVTFFSLPREIHDLIYDIVPGSWFLFLMPGSCVSSHGMSRGGTSTTKGSVHRYAHKLLKEVYSVDQYLNLNRYKRAQDAQQPLMMTYRRAPLLPALLVNRQMCSDLSERADWWAVSQLLVRSVKEVGQIPSTTAALHTRRLQLVLLLGTQETLQSEDIIPTLLATLSYTQRLIATLPTLTSLTVAIEIQHVASVEAFESFRADLEPYMLKKSGHLRHIRVGIDCFAYNPM